MPLDPAVSDQLTTLTLTAANNNQQRLSMIADNLAQGLGVVNTNLIQQQGGQSDDPGLFGSLQTASGVPAQGHVKGA